MKKIIICSLCCFFIVVCLVGCTAIPEHNYIGMTKAEVAAHLEKHAFRSRWSRNRFVIEISEKNIMTPYLFHNAAEVVNSPPVFSAGKWRCGFYPQRHWHMGWHSLVAKWHYQELFFQNGKVAEQKKGILPYKVFGKGGKSPFPQFPENFHQVSENIYRSNQPDDDEFESLFSFNGIRSVLNLRENNSDKKAIDRINSKHHTTAVALYELPLDTGNISEADFYKILNIIRDAPKPLLIHCWHGSDRTGCAVAAYRIVFENWSVEDAVSELMKPEYGHHKNIYPNIPALLRKADWKKIKAAVTVPTVRYKKEFESLFQKGGCTGAKIFRTPEWQKFLAEAKNDPARFEFLLSLFSSTDMTNIHICNWENASQGVLAVMTAEEITGHRWTQYNGKNPVVNEAVRQAAANIPQHVYLKKLLHDPACCRDLQKYFRQLHYGLLSHFL